VCLPKGIVSGWWFQPSEKYQLGCADIPNTWKNEIHVPNHQPDGNIMGISIFHKMAGSKSIVSSPKMDERMGFVECLSS